MRLLSIFAFLIVAPLTTQAITWVPGAWHKNQTKDGLEYWLYVPKSLAKKPTNGLVLQLHGCFSKAEAYKDGSNWPLAAETYRMVVAIPQSPRGSAIPGCWDAVSSKYETSRHTQFLAALIRELINERSLRIDPKAVFAAGLSAGATQSVLLACKHPDLIAGFGAVAGPMLGSKPGEVYKPKTTASDVARNCLRLAGDKASWLRTQKASIFVSDIDWVVNPVHSERTYAAFKTIYDVKDERQLDLSLLPGRRKDGSGIEVTDSKNRVRISYIIQEDLGHAWPTGAETSVDADDSHFNGDTINYPLYLGQFFSRRIR